MWRRTTLDAKGLPSKCWTSHLTTSFRCKRMFFSESRFSRNSQWFFSFNKNPARLSSYSHQPYFSFLYFLTKERYCQFKCVKVSKHEWMSICEEVSREGGAEQNEKEGAHQQNIVHSSLDPQETWAMRWNYINQDTIWKTFPPLCSLKANSWLCMTNGEHFALSFANTVQNNFPCLLFSPPPPPFLLLWRIKSCTSCMPCKCKRKDLTFIGPEFICIPALPSPYVSFYELAQAKH